MRVGVFTPAYNEHNRAILLDFADGIPGVVVHDDRLYRPCDVMVIFGLVKKSFRKSWAKGELLKRHRGPVIVVERGFVRRDEYWSVGLGGINGTADFRNAGSPPDRWEALGVECQPWRHKEGPVIVCGQVPWDVTVQDSDHKAWCRATVGAVRQMGLDPIFRPHPYARKRGVDYGVDCPISDRLMAEDLERASAVVTWSSNAGVEAVIAGVPVIAFDKMSMAGPVAGRCLTALRGRVMPDRRQWAADIAYAQWNRDELRSGLAWRHIARV